MRAISCVTLAGMTQASIENSPDSMRMSCSFRVATVEPCALPAPAAMSLPIVMPQPPYQVTSPDRFRSMAGSTPLVSKAVVPLPVLNSHSAIWSFS